MKNPPQTAPTKPLSLSPTVAYVESLAITDEASMEKAVAALSLLNKELDRLTADREKLTKPMNEALKEIRSRYKPFEGKLEAAISHVRKQMSSYQTELTEKAHQEKFRIANEIGNGLTIETALTKLANIDTPEQQIQTAHGSVSFRAVKKWRLVDITKVPREFLTTDDAAINAHMKASKLIEGIEYYTEQQPINRR